MATSESAFRLIMPLLKHSKTRVLSGTMMTVNVIHIPTTKNRAKLKMSLVLFPLVGSPFSYFLLQLTFSAKHMKSMNA